MRKLLFFLFPSFLALFVLSCSGDSDMPCVSCSERYESGSSSQQNSYGYCLFYNGNCYQTSLSNCNGTFYGSDNTCGDYGYYAPSSSSSRPSSSSASSSSSGLSACTGGTVTIGDNTWSQTWQKCNLNVEPTGTDVATNSSCYGGQASNCAIYGRLYDWATAMALPSSCNSISCSDKIKTPHHQGICPSGYHIPTTAEWNELEDYIESREGCTNCAAKYLKAKSGWSSCSVSGSSYYCLDGYGFSALPGGYGDSDGYFTSVGIYGNWWSASEGNSYVAYNGLMDYDVDLVYWGNSDKSYLFSVRCLQDYAD